MFLTRRNYGLAKKVPYIKILKNANRENNKKTFGNNLFGDKINYGRIARSTSPKTAAHTFNQEMKLNQKEVQLITELKNQEQLCVQKYDFYAAQAKDPELKNLFKKLLKREQNHYDMLENLLNGTVPQIKNKTPEAVKYEPKATHSGDQKSKEFDKFLCTDVIATEKYVATTYNNDLFYFVSTDVRNVLNAIMTDEQNHAEMIWKYKVANKMAA